MVTLGQYRAFSTENTLVFVDTDSGAVVLWLEVSYPPHAGRGALPFGGQWHCECMVAYNR